MAGCTVYRPVKGRLRVVAPYVQGRPTRRLLKGAGCRTIEWRKPHWLVARGRLHDVVAVLSQFWDVDVYVEGYATQKCDTRCVEAQGDECVCSCAGANHQGAAGWGWEQVGETTLINTEITRAHYRVLSQDNQLKELLA